jgi:prolyl-tRNA editing enzyme YbaK/EbsC (Cys-tRNA(Pro) deacylase)
MPLFAERTIFALDRIYINGGSRGFLVEIAADDLRRALGPVEVDAATTAA